MPDAPLQRAELTLEADVDQDGTAETGVFTMAGNLSVSPGVRTGYVVDDAANSAISVLSNVVEFDNQNPSKRRGLYVDLGGGQHTVDVEFRGWEGAIDENGMPLQWGNDPDVGRTVASATGMDPLTQIDCLMRYVTIGEYDSRQPATLEYGEYSTQGLYEPIDVVLEGPRMTRAAEDGSWFDGQMTLIAAASLEQTIDAHYQDEY